MLSRPGRRWAAGRGGAQGADEVPAVLVDVLGAHPLDDPAEGTYESLSFDDLMASLDTEGAA